VTQTTTIDILTAPNTAKNPTKMTAADLAPIVAMQLNIVGDWATNNATFSQGNGTVTYTSTHGVGATNVEPTYTTFNGYTAEKGNMGYGPLPQAFNTSVTQSFQVSGVDTADTSAAGKRVKPHGLPKMLHLQERKQQSGAQDQQTLLEGAGQ
jgi:hypothetical protein